jgi:hypothetical protein
MEQRFAMVPPLAAQSKAGARALRVLIAIAVHAKDGTAFPGLDRIAMLTGIERCKIPRAIWELESEGLLRRIPGGGRGKTNKYVIIFDRSETVTASGTVSNQETVAISEPVFAENSGEHGVETVVDLAENSGQVGAKQWSNRQPEHIEQIREQTREQRVRAKRLPSDFVVPPEWLADGEHVRAEHDLPPIDVSLEADCFRDYWLSNGSAKMDWYRTWLNWCRRAKERTNGRDTTRRVGGLIGAALAEVRRNAGQ